MESSDGGEADHAVPEAAVAMETSDGADQRRVEMNGVAYTYDEFEAEYQDTRWWPEAWDTSPLEPPGWPEVEGWTQSQDDEFLASKGVVRWLHTNINTGERLPSVELARRLASPPADGASP